MSSDRWRIAGEKTSPSRNDQINTGIGGSFLGEVLFRLSNLVLEHESLPPFWRELRRRAELSRSVGNFDYIAPQTFRVSNTDLSLGTTGQWWLSKDIAIQATGLLGAGYTAVGTTNSTAQNDYHYGLAPQALVALRLILGRRDAFYPDVGDSSQSRGTIGLFYVYLGHDRFGAVEWR